MRNKHAEMWDNYVDRNPENPGQEWGNEAAWNDVFARLFGGVHTWKRAIEIGAGAGKYTQRVFDANPDVQVSAVDVSVNFLDVLEDKMNTPRLHTFLLDYPHEAQNCSPLESAVTSAGWQNGTVDAVYSIDAMVHVEWQLVVSYIASAAKVLRNGGVIILSLADCGQKVGFDNMMKGLGNMYKCNTSPDGQFHYTSKDAVTYAMKRFGFNPIFQNREGDRDLWVVGVQVGEEAVNNGFTP